MIIFEGYPFLDNRDDEVLGFLAKEVMTPVSRLTCLKASGVTLGELKVYLQLPMTGLPIVTTDMKFTGYITLYDLNNAIGINL